MDGFDNRRQPLRPALTRRQLGVALAGWLATAALGSTALAESPIASRVMTLPPIGENIKPVVVTAIAADPRGQWLVVSGDDHRIRLIEPQSMRIDRVLGGDALGGKLLGQAETVDTTGHTDLIRTMAFDHAGDRLVSAGNDGRVILWDRRRDFVVAQVIRSAPALAAVRFSPSGRQMAAVGFSQDVYLISRDSTATPSLRCDCNDLRCCAYRDDGKLLAVAGRDGHVHLFDPSSGRERSVHYLHQARVRELTFLPSSDELVSVGDDGQLVRFHTGLDQVLSRTAITTGRLFCVAVIDSQRVATAGSDDRIFVVRLSPGGSIVDDSLEGHDGSIAQLVSVGGALFSGGFDATLRRWQVTPEPTGDPKIARGTESAPSEANPTPR